MQGNKRLTRKQILYKFIEENGFYPNDSAIEEFVNNHPWVRVKGLGSRSTTVINLSEKDGWYDPHSWAINYRNNMINRLQQVVDECLGVIPPDQIQVLCQPFGNIVRSTPVVCTPSHGDYEVIKYTYHLFKRSVTEDDLDRQLTVRMKMILKYLLRDLSINGELVINEREINTYRDYITICDDHLLIED